MVLGPKAMFEQEPLKLKKCLIIPPLLFLFPNFSNTLARSAISLASGESNLSYNSTSGELSLPTVNGGTF